MAYLCVPDRVVDRRYNLSKLHTERKKYSLLEAAFYVHKTIMTYSFLLPFYSFIIYIMLLFVIFRLLIW